MELMWYTTARGWRHAHLIVRLTFVNGFATVLLSGQGGIVGPSCLK